MTVPRHLYKIVLSLFLVTLCTRVVLIGYYNNNIGGIEPNVVYGIQRILLGQPLYQDPAGGFFAVMQYTPLYYYTAAAAAKVAGISALNVQGIYMTCRLLALVMNLLTVLIGACIIRMWKFPWYDSIVWSAPLLIMLTTHYFTRGDSMHLLFFAIAVYSILRYGRFHSIFALLIAAVSSAACLMVKQSGILLIAVIGFLLLFIERRLIAAVVYAAITVAAAWLIARICLGHSGGWQYFYANAWLGLRNGIDASFLYNMFISQFFMYMVPCYILGLYMLLHALNSSADGAFRMLAIGAAISWVFAVVTGLKIGSSNNYFIEFLFFVVLAMPWLSQQEIGRKVIARPFSRSVTLNGLAYFSLYVLVIAKTVGLFSNVFIEKNIRNNIVRYQADKNLYRYFTDTIQIHPGAHIFFTDRSFLDNLFIEYAILPNKDVTGQVYACSKDTYDFSAFTYGINKGLINYIVTDSTDDHINKLRRDLPFVSFDSSRFARVWASGDYVIYAFSGNQRAL